MNPGFGLTLVILLAPVTFSTVSFSTLYEGNLWGDPEYAVLETQAELDAFYARLGEPAPSVDFESEVVAVAVVGEPSWACFFSISEIQRNEHGVLDIGVKFNVDPMVLCTPEDARLVHVVSFERHPGVVVFRHDGTGVVLGTDTIG